MKQDCRGRLLQFFYTFLKFVKDLPKNKNESILFIILKDYYMGGHKDRVFDYPII